MEKVIIDPSLRSQLEEIQIQVELCDDAGHTLGYFVPARTDLRWAYTWARTAITEEELEQARRQPGARTTAEVLERLSEP
jgi:hypothetical protein